MDEFETDVGKSESNKSDNTANDSKLERKLGYARLGQRETGKTGRLRH